MIKQYEMEKFLKRMAKIYNSNNCIINEDIVYSQLATYNDGNRVPTVDLFNVKKRLRETIKGVDSNNYFDWINVMGQDNYKQFDKKLANSTKIYVSLPIDTNEIYMIVNRIWKFMIDNNIEGQSKISAFMRTDALVIRVCEAKDLLNLIQFINSLKYSNEIHPNPFLFHYKNVALARDSAVISYNGVLAKVISSYINEYGKNLENVNFITFKQYVEIKLKEYNSVECKILSNILKQTIDINSFVNFNSQIIGKQVINEEAGVSDVEILNAIVEKLKLYYDKEEIEVIIEDYIRYGNINFFTRKSGIRQNVSKNFDRKSFEDTMHLLVWSKLYKASYETYDKYGLEQLVSALEKLFIKENYSYFTNQNKVRSELEDICSYKFLMEVINRKFDSMKIDLNLKNLITYIAGDIEKKFNSVAQK